jgi:type I restriction enzyme S subunit
LSILRVYALNVTLILRADESHLLQSLLPFILQSENFVQYAISHSIGSTNPFVKWSDLSKFKIELPSLTYQKEISDVLWSVEKNIQNTEELIRLTEKLKHGLLEELLTQGIGHEKFKKSEFGEIPEQWSVNSTEDLVLTGKGSIKIGPFGSQLHKKYLIDSGYKVYGQENVFKNDFELGTRYVSRERFETLKSCELKSGDFLISMMGTIGKCSIVPDGIKQGIMDSHLLRLKLDREKVVDGYLIHLFQSNIIQRQVKELAVGGIMEGLSAKVIKKIIYPLPTIEEQRKIAKVLDSVDNQIKACDKCVESTKGLKKKLTNSLLSGELLITKEALLNVQ